MLSRIGVACVTAVLVAGCASSNQTLSGAEYDPWEGLNRDIYAVNQVFDDYLLRPVAKGYDFILPQFAQTGIGNFFDNLRAPRSALNNFLQGKPKRGFEDIARFVFNTTLGVGGLFDVASQGGLEENYEDIGQTLAVWGVPQGPYVVLPFFGPSTLRDTPVRPVGLFLDPVALYDNTSVRDKLVVLRIIALRDRLLDADEFLKDSEDKYIRVRESYLQNRQFEIYDGNPPMEDLYDDLLDEDFE